MLYVKLLKAIYGLLRSALLFYNKLSGNLISQGFELNPYDPCVANKMVNGSQFTVLWHVDDLKISHLQESELDKFIEHIKKNYQDDNIGKVKTSRGKVHLYLGMQLDFSVDGEVRITMVDYIDRMLQEYTGKIKNKVYTPAALHLFKVREEGDEILLDEDTASKFHTVVAQGIFLCKRARPDIQLTVAFLTTRVKQPDTDDLEKLNRLMGYLKYSRNLPLILSADDDKIIKWWVDASYATHPDFSSHTGATMSLGKGAVWSVSKKQRLNTTSSTESELVATYDAMPYIIWMNYFLEAQGYGTNSTVVYQDNKSAILLEINGKASSSKRT